MVYLYSTIKMMHGPINIRMYMFVGIASFSTGDWRHNVIVTRTIWEVSLTDVSRDDTGRSLLCYKGCASPVGLHCQERRSGSDIAWLLLDTCNNAGPISVNVAFLLYTDCCVKRKHVEGVFVRNSKYLSWSELISIGSEHNKHISTDSANNSCVYSVSVYACLDCV